MEENYNYVVARKGKAVAMFHNRTDAIQHAKDMMKASIENFGRKVNYSVNFVGENEDEILSKEERIEKMRQERMAVEIEKARKQYQDRLKKYYKNKRR